MRGQPRLNAMTQSGAQAPDFFAAYIKEGDHKKDRSEERPIATRQAAGLTPLWMGSRHGRMPAHGVPVY
ncbi:hypothetical protein ACFONI_08585 [Aeromonas media]|uniref:hypothetical protein n=1 Tax=Aeromonas media TaxID=651 RepID=UPI003619281C